MSERRKTSLRLDAQDEYMHENTGEPHFNESMYFNFFDPELRCGGFLRIGNRPNERYAETTVCLYQPDGSVLFSYQRPEIEGNEAFDAGGIRFEVDQPFEKLRIAYRGKACHLREPMEMSDPRAAFSANPFLPVEIELGIDGVGPMAGGERTRPSSGHEQEFARGHYEQHHRAVGVIAIGEDRQAFHGLGLRDHSWGPRSWQAPAFYRWLTANFDDDFGFMGSLVASRDGSETRGGFVHRGRDLVGVRGLELETDWSGPERVHERIRLRLDCADGDQLHVEGRVLSLIPLRNRRNGGVTRISEGLTEWSCEGRTGYGLSEYLDQVS
jgi:hypothetical protein